MAAFEHGAPREPRTHFDFCDRAVFDLVEQRHQPSNLGTKRKVCGQDFIAGLSLNIQPNVHKNGRGRALPNRFTVPDAEVVDLSEVHGLAKPD
jgi:hypothetical protein